MSTIWVFDNMKNKYNLYRGEDCMKNVCITLREHAAMKLIEIENNKILSLTEKELISHQNSIMLHLK